MPLLTTQALRIKIILKDIEKILKCQTFDIWIQSACPAFFKKQRLCAAEGLKIKGEGQGLPLL